ncbi:translation initiation factor 2 [Pseudomonas sp. 7P_10.2_Bac1]|uniref:translation initiation factor 2 n=1 Tax=Pseudomonas sp. 7P_10.2_Bac1 TaxID=2971614 RepID=UPI0021C8FA30|nr:translation initiation factor 2 [Pseudomonas sp. 7P_10.2_Bac1]MCU1728600.1 translation initiation factor 2 [Pseudomonas sp. 7P_10.2_Bac1]
MRATFCVGLILAGVLAAFGAVGASANQSTPETVSAQPKAAHKPAKPAATAHKAPVKKTSPAATKTKKTPHTAKKRLPANKVDLSLPPEMVRQLRPLGAVPMPAHKPLLPNMFAEKQAEESPFQLNGRLLSNEMGLQLRNEARQNEIDGAALDFEFKQ